MATKSAALTETLSRLISKEPFWATYLYDRMTITETSTIPTAATDGVSIWVNPDYFTSLKTPKRIFLIAHEVAHGILRHMPRMKLYMDRGFGPDLAPFSVKHYNKAADYVINDLLHHCGLGEMPEGGLYRPDVSYQDLVDEVYCRIDKDDDDNNNGSGGHGGFDQHLPPQDPSNQPSDADVKRSIASARNAAKAMGKLPGALERLIGEVLEPTQDWKEVLRNHITARAGRDTATWTKPNRRRLALAPHIYMPGVTGFQIGGVAIINDTSGSVSEKETNQFMGEVSSILAECHPEWCKILWVDSQVAGVDDVDDPEEIPHLTPKGGGGTDMGAGFKYMDEHGIRPNMCIVLTDGYTPWGEAPDYEVIWGITAKDIEAPFGKTVHVKVE